MNIKSTNPVYCIKRVIKFKYYLYILFIDYIIYNNYFLRIKIKNLYSEGNFF